VHHIMEVEMNQEMLKVLGGMRVLDGAPSMRVLEGPPSMRVLEGATVLDGRIQAAAAAAAVAMPGLVQQENSMDGGMTSLDGGGGGSISPTLNGAGNSVAPAAPSGYLLGLLQERQTLKDSDGMDLTKRLLGQEIERLQTCGKSLLVRSEDRRLSDVTKDKAVKLSIRVLVPVRDHPKSN
ncbi:unnamed protein product, partial [Meganyctiphanes norvegica]